MQESEFTGCVNKVQGKAAGGLKKSCALEDSKISRSTSRSAANTLRYPESVSKIKTAEKISAPLPLTLLAASCRIN
jgi:hypothetical protein